MVATTSVLLLSSVVLRNLITLINCTNCINKFNNKIYQSINCINVTIVTVSTLIMSSNACEILGMLLMSQNWRQGYF